MPLYAYTALDDNGRKHTGQQEAPNEGALEALLEESGQWLSEARLCKRGGLVRARRLNPKVPRRVLIEFFLQLNIQIRAGIPILTALSFGASECSHVAFRRVQQDLLEKIEAGESLHDAMAHFPRTFPTMVLNLVQAGEMSGRLAETFQELHHYYEWMDKLVSDIRQALVYPGFILICTIAFVFLLFTFLIPKFATLLTELKVPLPVLTQVVMDISDFTLANWYWILAAPVAGFFALRTAVRRSPAMAQAYDKLKLGLPIFGSLNRLICLSRFTHNLAVLYRAGVPLLDSLRLCSGLVGNRVLGGAVGNIEVGVNEGVSMHEAMKREKIFPGLILQMVQVGESTGDLGASLQNVAEYYNDIIPRRIKKMFSILEPTMIIFLIGLVATIALAIFLPIANLLNAR